MPVFAQTRLSLSFSQAAIDDWKLGNKQTFEINNSLDLKNKLIIDLFTVSLSYRHSVGFMLEKGDIDKPSFVQPTDNELFGEASVKYSLDWLVDPFFSASFRTQIVESFKLNKNERTNTASFWDPVTSQQTMGFVYIIKEKKDELTLKFGISLKQIRSKDYTQLTDDFKTKNIKERYKGESGIELKTESVLAIDSSVTYRGRIELFGSFDNLEKWTSRFENEFQITIWKFLGLLVKIDLFYDEKQSLSLQYKQNIRVGFVANF